MPTTSRTHDLQAQNHYRRSLYFAAGLSPPQKTWRASLRSCCRIVDASRCKLIGAPEANPHPSQVSWTHASPPAHLILPWLHSYACTAAPPPALRLSTCTAAATGEGGRPSARVVKERSKRCIAPLPRLTTLCPPPTPYCAYISRAPTPYCAGARTSL